MSFARWLLAVCAEMPARAASSPAGLASPPASARHMAVREGFRCSACHVNVTGGGKRNDTIAAHARDILRYPRFFDELLKPVEAFSGDINQYLSIGADLRTSVSLIFQELGDNGKVENNTAFRGRLDTTEIEVNEAELYGEMYASFIAGRITWEGKGERVRGSTSVADGLRAMLG